MVVHPHLDRAGLGSLTWSLPRQVVVAAVEKLRPDNLLLGKAEDAEAAALQAAVKDVPRVCDQILAFENPA